jgi:signal transduction histidine kinase
MTLRLRLLLMIGVSTLLLWCAVSVWMLHGVERQMNSTLDRRLAMSANMVAGLMSQNPAAWASRPGQIASTMPVPGPATGIMCQVSLRGEVVARTPGASPEAVAAAPLGYAERIVRGLRWRTYTVEAHGMRVTTADRMAEREALLGDVMTAASVPFAVALGGSLIVLWFGVGSGLRPLERLRQVLARRTPDTLAPIADVPVPRDLRPFVDTLNSLLERVGQTVTRERRFTSDAAHELRTPLTAIKTHLQVARITRGTDASDAMEYAEEGVARMHHTLSQLLTLAKVEGAFSWDEGDVAGAGDVAHLAVRDAAPGGAIRIEIDAACDRAELAAPRALAITALRNLLDNALRHSPEPGSVLLRVACRPDAVDFEVSDRGPGLSDADLAVATERFWRRESGWGSGLGLSIVAAITERFGGRLAMARREGGGLVVTLSLPRQASAEVDKE